eukprot:1316783-Amorphochlora_amoeboformis.AAC.1
MQDIGRDHLNLDQKVKMALRPLKGRLEPLYVLRSPRNESRRRENRSPPPCPFRWLPRRPAEAVASRSRTTPFRRRGLEALTPEAALDLDPASATGECVRSECWKNVCSDTGNSSVLSAGGSGGFEKGGGRERERKGSLGRNFCGFEGRHIRMCMDVFLAVLVAHRPGALGRRT